MFCVWAPVSWSANIYCIIFQYTFHFITYKAQPPHTCCLFSRICVCAQRRCYSLSALLRTHVGLGLGLLITFYTVRLYTMYSFTLYFMQTLLGQVARKISPVSRQMPPTTLYCISFFRTCSLQFQQYNLGRQLISVTHAQRFPDISHGSMTASLLLSRNLISPRPTALDTVFANILKCYNKINLWLPKFAECLVCSLQILSRRELKSTTYYTFLVYATKHYWRDVMIRSTFTPQFQQTTTTFTISLTFQNADFTTKIQRIFPIINNHSPNILKHCTQKHKHTGTPGQLFVDDTLSFARVYSRSLLWLFLAFHLTYY